MVDVLPQSNWWSWKSRKSLMEKAFALLQELGNNGGEFMKKTGNTHIYLSEFLGTFIFLLCGIGCVGALKLAGASFGQ